MKFLLFSNIIAPYRVGLYNRLSELLKNQIKFYFDSELEDRKWDINENAIRFNYEIINSFKIKKITTVSNNTVLPRTIYFPVKILKICFIEKPELVISTEMGWRTIFCIIYAKIFFKKSFFLSEVTPQSENNISKIKKLLRRIIIRLSNGAIAHGILSKEYLVMNGMSENKIVISPDSIDNEFYLTESQKYTKKTLRDYFKLDHETFVFLFVGRFIHLKGIDLFIKNINSLYTTNKKEFRVLLVGGEKQELIDLIRNYNEDIIKIFSFKQSKDLIPFYVVSDCLILPTRQDVWGFVVNEAIACGLPVAVSKYAGCVPDLLEDNITGYIFDPLNEHSFVETLKKCIDQKKRLAEFAERAKEKLKIYNHANAAKKIYDFMLNNNPSQYE